MTQKKAAKKRSAKSYISSALKAARDKVAPKKATEKATAQKTKDRQKKYNDQEVLELIQKRAYTLFEERGCEHGHDDEDWNRAESLVKEEIS